MKEATPVKSRSKLAKKRAENSREIARRLRGPRAYGLHPTGCGKARYGSKSEARSALRRSMGKGTMKGKEYMDFYRCERCEAWHIGHSRFGTIGRPGEASP